MKFGVNTLIWSVTFDPETIPLGRLAEAGVDGIEPAVFSASIDPAVLRKACERHGFGLTICSVNPPGANPISDDQAERASALEHWRSMIAILAEAGGEALVGPTCSPVGHLPGRRRTADEWKRAVEFHQALGPALDEAQVELAVEPLNRFETYFLNTAEDAVRLCKEVAHPRIGILLDTFHSNIEDKSTPQAYRACGKLLKHVHTCENDRGIPGSGHVDWLETLKAIRSTGYDGWLTIESFNANMPEIAAATAIWRDLAPTTDDIAIKGVRFLRALWATMED
jgi:D-psicose/D-tagatose/L-ribulose 3-epimerase